MAERLIPKLLIPEKHKPFGWAKRIFVIATVATGITVITSRNTSDGEIANLIEKSRTQVALSSGGQVAYVASTEDSNGTYLATLEVVNNSQNKKILLAAANKDIQLGNLAWSPSGKKLAFTFGSSTIHPGKIDMWNLLTIEMDNRNIAVPLDSSSVNISHLRWINEDRIAVDFSSGANTVITP